MSENYRRQDYKHYSFGIKEWVRYVLEGIGLVGLIAYFFYRSILAFLFLSPLIFLYVREKRILLNKKRKEDLNVQFKDALKSISGSLQAGYSMENAFLEAYRDMTEYHGPDSVIAKELFGIKVGIRNNQAIEDLVEDMGNRSGLEDILDFAGILRVGKQTGGNINVLFENCMMVIEEKINVKQEILTLISAKRLESRIMSIIPFFIILYVDMTSEGYFNALYAGIAGRILMTICLMVYLVAIRLSQRIMEIKV